MSSLHSINKVPLHLINEETHYKLVGNYFYPTNYEDPVCEEEIKKRGEDVVNLISTIHNLNLQNKAAHHLASQITE